MKGLLPPDNHINNSLTPDRNTSPISLGQENDKLNEPATPDSVSKLSEQLSNININDPITLNPDKNSLLNKGKLNFNKRQLVSYTLISSKPLATIQDLGIVLLSTFFKEQTFEKNCFLT